MWNSLDSNSNTFWPEVNGEITFVLHPIVNKIKYMINHLKLIDGRIDTEIIEKISQMKQLKWLELTDIDDLTDEHMVELANGLSSQLEKLQLKGSTAENLTTIGLKKMLPFVTKLSLLTLKSAKITIDADDYKAMMRTLQKRTEKVILSIEWTGNGGQVEVDETILLANRDCFFIVKKIDNDNDYEDSYFDYFGNDDYDRYDSDSQ